MLIKISYLAETREALLQTDEASKPWSSIVRACQDFADVDLIRITETQVTLPWWTFLRAREPIGYHVSKNNVKIEFSNDAKKLLQEAAEKRHAYSKAVQPPALHENELKEILKANGFKRPLKDHQTRNVLKLASLPSGATFSVPGAGKTTEALAYFCCRKSENTKLLIVCPKNALAVWEEQVAEIFPEQQIHVVRLTGGAANIELLLKQVPEIALITYHQVPYVENVLSRYLLENDVAVFLDESHRMKRGNSGVIGASILTLAHLPNTKCIMSGTPLPNGIGDLVPQFQFLYPEIPVEAANVKELIKPIFVRTTKSELPIPPVTRIETRINLSPAQRMLYQLLCSEYARENFNGISANDRRKLRALGKSALRLIQLVSNPALLARKIDFEHKDLLRAVLEEGDSPKLEYVTRRARELASKGQKTIIWSSFVQNVELVATRLIDIGADFIHGGVEAGSDEEEYTRERKIKRFHDDKSAWVLVANPAACSEGISLHTVCHHAIYLDRNYNAAQYLQSEDRIHRLGLKPDQKTIIEILCSPDTVDVSVAARLSSKVQMMKDVLDDPGLNIDPIPYDPDNNEEFSYEDATNFLEHIKTEALSQ